MKKLEKMSERDYPILMRVLFGLDSPTPVPSNPDDFSEETKDLDFIDSTLNESQRNAVKFALASREVALIHGPPGVRYLPKLQHPKEADCRKDGQDLHSHRAHPPTRQTFLAHSCLRSFQYLRRQHSRASRSSQAPHCPPRPSRPSSTQRP